MKELARKTAASVQYNSKGENKQIPKIIHQTFETLIVPDGMYDAAQSWIKMNPTFEHRVYDADSRRDFIKTSYDSKVLKAYDKLTHGAFRADLWRYCKLYLDGGVYSDLDQVCVMPISDLLEPDDTFVSARAGNLSFAIYNGFICAKPHHPFLKAAIDRAVDIIISNDIIDGYMTTGPWNLGVSANKCLGRPPKSEQIIGVSESGGHRLRLLKKHPKTANGPGYLSSEEKTFLLTEYEGYRKDLSSAGISHWQDVLQNTTLLGKIKSKVKNLGRLAFKKGNKD